MEEILNKLEEVKQLALKDNQLWLSGSITILQGAIQHGDLIDLSKVLEKFAIEKIEKRNAIKN